MTDPSAQVPDPADERLLALLRRAAAERDPVPAAVVEAARQSFVWRTIDEELAELVSDSHERGDVGVLVRSSTEEVRLLVFEAPELTLELEILPVGTLRRLVGQLVPPCPAHVTVDHATGASSQDTDDLGRFLLSDIPAGRARLRCRQSDPGSAAAAVVTPWLEL